jgi:hypothetical protein
MGMTAWEWVAGAAAIAAAVVALVWFHKVTGR